MRPEIRAFAPSRMIARAVTDLPDSGLADQRDALPRDREIDPVDDPDVLPTERHVDGELFGCQQRRFGEASRRRVPAWVGPSPYHESRSDGSRQT